MIKKYNSTFTQDFFGRDIAELKDWLEHVILQWWTDEVVQSLEYGVFLYIQSNPWLQYEKEHSLFAGGTAALHYLEMRLKLVQLKQLLMQMNQQPKKL